MPDINLLPEDLRREDKNKDQFKMEEIRYSDPEKFKIEESRVKSSASKKTGPNFFEKIKIWYNKRKSLKQLEKEEQVNSARTDKPIEPPRIEAIHGIPPPPPKIWPEKVPEQKPASLPEKKILPETKIIFPPPSNGNGNGRRFHQPQERPSSNFEVDLFTDKTLLFSPVDLLNKLKAGAIVLLLLFILMGSAYLLLIKYQPPSPSDSDIDSQISATESKLANYEKEKKEVVMMDSLLKRLNEAIGGHLYWSKLFIFLEANTTPDIYYDNLSFDKDGGISLAVSAKDYTAMAQQLAVFQSLPEVERVNFKGAYLSEEKFVKEQEGKNIEIQISVVKATIGLYLKKDFFTKN